jgi:aflatoxin B1 aldehyde reductase
MSKARIILGLMTFGPDADKGARVTDVEDLKKALDVFQGYGYDEVDTARLYVGGLQEGYTRQAGWKERGLTLATKVYPVTPGIHKPATITEYFETSLKELGSDSVDVSKVSLRCIGLLSSKADWRTLCLDPLPPRC